MNTNNKILVGMGISLMAVAVLFIGIGSASESASGVTNITFTVTTEEKSDVSIIPVNKNFGTLRETENTTLSPSFIANNSGMTNATLEAQFRTNLTNVSDSYGLVSTDENYVILAQYFDIGTLGDMSFMDNAGNLVSIGSVGAGTIKDFNVTLTVPDGQPAKTYQGMIDIVITFEP